MEITEVKIKPVGNRSDRLKAFCSITFDDAFVVRDLKIIDGPDGLFVAMPSRKLTEHCPSCHAKNSIRARYCDQCGKHLPESMKNGHDKTHADIAHPINASTRSYIQQTVIAAYDVAIMTLRRTNLPPIRAARWRRPPLRPPSLPPKPPPLLLLPRGPLPNLPKPPRSHRIVRPSVKASSKGF